MAQCGAIAAVSRKAVSEVIMRVLDIIMSFPGIALAAVFVSILGNSVRQSSLLLALCTPPSFHCSCEHRKQYGEDYVKSNHCFWCSCTIVLLEAYS